MTTMPATDLSRNMSRVLDRMEHDGEELVILRNNHPVARILPGAPEMRALDAFADLFGILPDEEGDAWTKDMRTFDRPATKELKDPYTRPLDCRRSHSTRLCNTDQECLRFC